MALLDPQLDPTSPQVATVKGIVPPAKPQAMAGMAPAAPTGMAPALDVATPENDSVSERIAAITAQDSPLMEQARTSGLKLANSRGLLNSTMAIGAAQDSTYRAATPIASQEAAQAAGRNAQRLGLTTEIERMRAAAGWDKEARAENFGYQTQLQQDQFDARMNELKQSQAADVQRLQMQINSAEGMQKTQLQAQMDQLVRGNELELVRMGAAFEFNKAMAAVQNGYAVDMAKLNASLQSALQAQGNTEQIQRMMVDFGNQMKLNQQQNAAAIAQIKAQGDVEMKKLGAQIEATMKELTLQLNNQNALAAAQSATQLFGYESQIRAALMNNPNIPAAERAALEAAITGLSAPTMAFINKVLGQSSGGTGTGGGMTPSPTPSPSPTLTPTPTPTPTGMGGSFGGMTAGGVSGAGSYVSGGITPPNDGSVGGGGSAVALPGMETRTTDEFGNVISVA